jgi:hypothetical protein
MEKTSNIYIKKKVIIIEWDISVDKKQKQFFI